MQVLRIDEWKGASGRWYVADIHTWTGWRECADVLDAKTLEDYIDILTNKYKATVDSVIGTKSLLFSWPKEDYKNAHQFKLDVNRIARKKKYMVEEWSK